MLRWLATLAVLSHALIAWLHGQAHKDLGVGLNEWQTWFVRIVILAAPWIAIVLVWTKWSRLGYLLLALSMAGALPFGIYHHYIAVSPDHVAHLPAGRCANDVQDDSHTANRHRNDRPSHRLSQAGDWPREFHHFGGAGKEI